MKRQYSLDPGPRMISNEVDEKELMKLKRFLVSSRTWEILKTIFANAATCSALAGDHAEARVYNAIAEFDVDALESLMEQGAFNAPRLTGDLVHGEPEYIDP